MVIKNQIDLINFFVKLPTIFLCKHWLPPTYILTFILIVSECGWLEGIKTRHTYHSELGTNREKVFEKKKIKNLKKRYAN